MRSLAAHLSHLHRDALASLVDAQGYEERVRRAAPEGAAENWRSNRWHLGWASYNSAAGANEGVCRSLLPAAEPQRRREREGSPSKAVDCREQVHQHTVR